MTRESALPHKYWPIQGTALDIIKLIAAALMVVDHVDDIIFDRAMPHLMLVGRTVFPLFCFATAAYAMRAGVENIPRYAVKIAVLAVFVQPVSYLTRDYADANILFTLAIGAVLIAFMAQASHRMRCIAFIFALLSVLFPDAWEYGIVGAFVPAAMYLVMKEGDRYIPWLIFLLAFTNFGGLVFDFLAVMSVMKMINILLVAAATILFPLMVVLMCRQIPGEERKMPKYFLHVFYPAHLIIIALIAIFV